MKTETITYTFDPASGSLTIYMGGKPKGGFMGAIAERKFAELLESGAEINFTNMDTTALHKVKVRRLRALWINQGVDQYRDAILEQYGVTSTKDLCNEQLDELIKQYSHEWHSPVSPQIMKLRSEALTLLKRIGIESNGSDWSMINDFLMSPKIAGKLLYQLTEPELITLGKKLHSIISKRLMADDVRKQQNLN